MQVASGKIISLEEFKPLITDKPKEVEVSDKPQISIQELQRIAIERASLLNNRK